MIKKEKAITYRAALQKIKKLEADIEFVERRERETRRNLVEEYDRKINVLAVILGYFHNSSRYTESDPYNYVLSRIREVRGEDRGEAFYALKEEIEYLRTLVASQFGFKGDYMQHDNRKTNGDIDSMS